MFKWNDKVLISVDMNTTYVESSKTCFLGSSPTFNSSCGFSFCSGATLSTLFDSCFTFNFVDFFKHFPISFLISFYYLALISYDLRISNYNVWLKQQALPIFHHFHKMMNIVTIRTSRPKFKTDSTSIVYLYSTLFIKKPSSPLLSEALENTKMYQHPPFHFLDSNVTT